MNNLIGFYLHEGCDSEGRTLAGIWAMSDDELMHTHDVVQWLFPLTEPSSFNPTAPVLTELESFRRFMRVFGLDYIDDCLQQVAHRDIWMHLNHNWLRFTRILKSLTNLGLNDEAMEFFKFLQRKVGNVQSMSYWRKAVGLDSNSV
jgi:hypothetical protein